MSETRVIGRLYNQQIPDRAIQDVLSYLTEKGYYNVNTAPDNGALLVKFARDGRIESVVNELVPKIEQLGYDTWHDLELQGFNGSDAVSRYTRGRIIRDY